MIEPSEREEVKQISQVFEGLRASGRSSEEIFVSLYSDLKQLARRKVARQPPGASMRASSKALPATAAGQTRSMLSPRMDFSPPTGPPLRPAGGTCCKKMLNRR